jgi:DNA-directed RNA polymerase subunit M/transcription elongation factor TFIIS
MVNNFPMDDIDHTALTNLFKHDVCDEEACDTMYMDVIGDCAFNDVIRTFYVDRILNTLQTNDEFKRMNWKTQCNIAGNLERGCYDDTVEHAINNDYEVLWKNQIFKHCYEIRIRKTLMNLDINSSVNMGEEPFILREILEGDNLGTTIGGMSAVDINPRKSDVEREYIISHQPDTITYKESSLYTCQYCGSNRVHTEHKQTCGGDEAESIHVFCTKCKKRIR